MDTSGTIKFDSIKVNTDLAVKYLEENNEFYPILNDDKYTDYKCSQNVTDCGHTYKLYWLKKNNEELKWCAWNPEGRINSSIDLLKILKNLSKLIEKHAELFAQLEYMIRKIPIDDTKSQIGLIVQNLLCCGKEENWRLDNSNDDDLYYYVLPMGVHTPLLCLGCVAQIGEEKACLLIQASNKTAIVCHLFTKLCHEVGLVGINFVFMENIPRNLHPGIPKVNIDCMSGTTGVIAEKGDLDSAVDVFLASTTMAPWKMRRILVQECIYNAFKKAVEWKCTLRKTKMTPTNILEHLYPTYFAYDDKLLLLNYAGNEDETTYPPLIFIEAYRTTKELISLIKLYNVPYLSLWTNHISEANEIAYNTDVPIVWINDFGKFDGPPRVSQAIFSRISMLEQKAFKINNYDILNAHKGWLKLTLENRREIMSTTLEQFMSTHDQNENASSLLALHNALINWESDQIIEVSTNKMCVCLDIPFGLVMCTRFMDYVPFLRSLVSGNAVIFNKKVLHEDYVSLVKAFQKAGVPVADNSDIDKTVELDAKMICDQKYVTRVVWTNFESIFAN